MRKLLFGVALAVLVTLPATVLCRNVCRTASTAGVASSRSAGKVIRSSLGRGIASRTLTVSADVAQSEGRVAGSSRESGPGDRAFGLLPCYPNPFNPVTTIEYRPAEDTQVELAVYEASGRLVRVLARHRSEAGDLHEVVWDGTGEGGEQLPSGVYLLRLQTEKSAEMRKLVLLK